jgi:hypothetical protein
MQHFYNPFFSECVLIPTNIPPLPLSINSLITNPSNFPLHFHRQYPIQNQITLKIMLKFCNSKDKKDKIYIFIISIKSHQVEFHQTKQTSQQIQIPLTFIKVISLALTSFE